jgi:hypothetical protein
MKLATQAVHDLISNGSSVKALPKLTAEWEHNRFSALNPTTVTPAYNPDPEWNNIYSLDAITLPFRPDSGIAKARFSADLQANPGYRDRPDSSRYYLSTDTDLYKYWSSDVKCGTTPVSGAYPFSTPITITTTYQTQVVANKIVVGFDMTYSRPVGFTIQFSEDGDNWFDAAINPALDNTGKVTLYRDPAGNWAGVARYDGITLLAGVRIIARSMLDPNVHLDVIQMGLRLEDDLSDFVVNYDRTFEISDRSVIAPVGKASSNTATVILSNTDKRFNNDNALSPYFGLIGKRAKLWMDLSIDASSTGGLVNEPIREFTMWADSWTPDSAETVTINLKDSSAVLQEVMTPRVFWQSLTVGAVIWQLLDIIGMTNYYYKPGHSILLA